MTLSQLLGRMPTQEESEVEQELLGLFAPEINSSFLYELQAAHDRAIANDSYRAHWRSSLEGVALRHNLTIPGGDDE